MTIAGIQDAWNDPQSGERIRSCAMVIGHAQNREYRATYRINTFRNLTMSLRNLMMKDLARGLATVRDGHEIVPTWRIMTPEGDYLILTRFDPDKPEQREHMLTLVPLFMAWKMATAFVLTTETWLGPERTRSGEEAVLAIGVSHTERLGVLRRIRRMPGLVFMPPEWLRSDALDDHPDGINPPASILIP